jgi:basic membrane protein A and related proteins
MKKNVARKLLTLATAAVLLISLAACGSSAGTASPSTSPAASADAASAAPSAGKDFSTIKVALLLPGSANDKGWNQSAYEGLEEIKALGCETAYSESVAASDYEAVFRGYADKGFDVVFGHGVEFGDAATAVAKDYPNTMFCITSSDLSVAPNVCSLQNLNNEQGFIAGVVAALATKSGKVGAIGGMEISSIQSYILGFQQGVAYVNNGTTALTAFTGDFDDATKVKEQTNAFIEQGADIIAQDADQAGLGLFEAVKNAKAGVYAIGSVKDQYEECPGRVLTSATNTIGDAMAVALKQYAEGKLTAQCYRFGIKEGVIGLADYHDCANVLTDEQKTFIKTTMTKVADGEITVKSAQN